MTAKSSFSNQMKVGIFIVLGLAILSASLFLVGGDRLFKEHVFLHAHFENVQGLNEGSVVSLSGVNVGNVEEFIFMPEENKLDVVLKVGKEYLPRITTGSAVDIRTQGALGDKFLFIIPGPPNEKPLKNGDKIDVVPPTDLLAVISDRSSEVGKIFDIIKEVDKFAKTINAEGRADRIVRNFAEMSQDLRATAKDSREMIAEMKGQDAKKLTAAVEKLDRILTKIDRGDGTLGALINDNSLHESLKSMIGASDKKKSIKSLIRSSIEKAEKE